jgi:large subunit ribosomal protein L25
VTLPKKELHRHIDRGAHVFDLSLNGKAEKVLVKDVQYDHLGLEILHIDSPA